MNQDDVRLNGTNGFHDESFQASLQHLHEPAAGVDELGLQRLTHKAFEVLCEGLESDDVSLRLDAAEAILEHAQAVRLCRLEQRIAALARIVG